MSNKSMNLIILTFTSMLMEGLCEDDYLSLDKLDKIPLQDLRVVRDKSTESPMTNFVTQNPFLGRNNDEDFSWLDDAIKDIAYYLRAHKFNEYDRRYESNGDKAPKEYYGSFPRPPLRALHWEVHKFCETSFMSCANYLRKKIAVTGLRRVDDTSVVIQEQKWNTSENASQVEEVEVECQKSLRTDDIRADPFQGPIERYQWRSTASYYMCCYTMNEVPDLKHINESCDNFAHCLDKDYGPNNGDIRADDKEPFMCAFYSFCPDPCCPTTKHMYDMETCLNSSDNPCYEINRAGERDCSISRSKNTNFHDIILNRWNVSCHCPLPGYEWSSKYGVCIDIDECMSAKHNCKEQTEICINLPGSFFCACQWGYVWSNGQCSPHGVVSTIALERNMQKKEEKTKVATSLVKRLYDGCKKLYFKIKLLLVKKPS